MYITPNIFMRVFDLFVTLLKRKNDEIEGERDKYEQGIVKLEEAKEMIDNMQEELEKLKPILEAKSKQVEQTMKILEVETAQV